MFSSQLSFFQDPFNVTAAATFIWRCMKMWHDFLYTKKHRGTSHNWPSHEGQLSDIAILLLPSVPSNRWYFASRAPASWFAPTLRLLRASVRVFHEVLTPDFSQVLSISRSRSMGSENWALILSRSPILILSWSPSRYQLVHISITSSSTRPRSSGVNLPPERGDFSNS